MSNTATDFHATLRRFAFVQQGMFAHEDDVWVRGDLVVTALEGWSLSRYTFDDQGQIDGMIDLEDGYTTRGLFAALTKHVK